MSLCHWINSKIWQNRFGQVVEDAGSASGAAPRRAVHVVVMDGTLSSLEPGFETNAGLAYQLLKRSAGPVALQQVWFVGNHGDVGGQVMGSPQTRPLSNIPFVWMMQRLQEQGLPLPKAWTEEFVQDVHAPSTGNWSGLNWVFWARSRRLVGRFRSESIHPSVADGRPGRLINLHNDAGG